MDVLAAGSHHHLVVNSTGEDLEEIRRLWIYGDNVEVRRLEFNQGHTYEDLASYLTKEPREWGAPTGGRADLDPLPGAGPDRVGDGDRPGLCNTGSSTRGYYPAKSGTYPQWIRRICLDQIYAALPAGPETGQEQAAAQTEKE